MCVLMGCMCYYRDEAYDVLAVADWGQRLAFYQLSGKQVSVFMCSHSRLYVTPCLCMHVSNITEPFCGWFKIVLYT